MNDTTSPAWPTPAPHSLVGRAALVTGSAVGIGRATVLQMAAAGAFVGIHCRQSHEEAEQTLADVQAFGGQGIVLQADLADPAQAQRLVDEFVAATGRLDILVNNAGSPIARVKLEECSLELWQQVIATNLTGSFAVTQRAIPHLRASGKGAIVNNLTLSIQTGGANGAGPYAAAKGALQVMTRTLARELAPEVRTNAVMPGVIETRHHEQYSTPERMAQYRQETPLGRNGAAEEVAAAITFLASDAASFINGALLDINGGRFLR
jgi:3-oxoacyl-[acyl-carrier protein] reductase